MFTLAAAFMMSAAAFAQGNGGGQRPQMDREQMIKMRTDRTVEQYKLNDEQAKQLLELNTKYADTMMMGFGGRMGGGRMGGGRMRNGQGGPGGGFGQGGGSQLTPEQQAQRDEMRKQREESTKAYNAELEKIFTPEQYKQYQEDQQNRGQRGGRRGGQRGPRQQNLQNQQSI